jgi:hypothetical protein
MAFAEFLPRRSCSRRRATVRRSIPTTVLIGVLALALGACGRTEANGQENPFIRSSATQTALALRGTPLPTTPTLPAPPSDSAAASTEPPAAGPEASPLPEGDAPSAVPADPTEPAAMPEPSAPPPLPTLAVPTLPVLNNEQRWRAQQENRSVFEGGPFAYVSRGSTELWWYDPIAQQPVILGTITGEFLAQAQFRLRGQGVDALEVPYRINQDYGLTSLSAAFVERMQRAGYTESVEAYVFLTPEIARR